jgi:kynurenine formamidase
MNIGIIWEQFRDYKEKKGCLDCKIKYPHHILEFDHVMAAKKIDTVYRVLMKYGEKKAWEEVEKCEVVCANCHKQRTFLREEASYES